MGIARSLSQPPVLRTALRSNRLAPLPRQHVVLGRRRAVLLGRRHPLASAEPTVANVRLGTHVLSGSCRGDVRPEHPPELRDLRRRISGTGRRPAVPRRSGRRAAVVQAPTPPWIV